MPDMEKLSIMTVHANKTHSFQLQAGSKSKQEKLNPPTHMCIPSSGKHNIEHQLSHIGVSPL